MGLFVDSLFVSFPPPNPKALRWVSSELGQTESFLWSAEPPAKAKPSPVIRLLRSGLLRPFALFGKRA